MSSNEQELETAKQENDKDDPDTSKQPDNVLESEKALGSENITDSDPKGCEEKKEFAITQNEDALKTKSVLLNKLAAFDDDDDDFNSDELQLRWDDDDDESNTEMPSVEKDTKQLEDDLPKNNDQIHEAVNELEKALEQSNKDDTDAVDTKQLEDDIHHKNEESKNIDSANEKSTSLVMAVNELENALVQANDDDTDAVNSKQRRSDDGDHKNEKIIEETEINSSKEIIDNIDEILGTDNASEKGDDQDPIEISSEISTDEIDKPKETGDVEKSEINPEETSLTKTKDIEETENTPEVSKYMDSMNIDETSDTLDDSQILSSTVNDSFLEGNVKFEHGLKRPDMMLEIPTQEIIDCLDEFDDSDCDKNDDQDEVVDISDKIQSLERDIDSKVMDDEVTENISQVVTNDIKNDTDPGQAMTETATTNDVEMIDNSIDPKITDNVITMDISETIGEENDTEKISEEVFTSNNDEMECATVEDSKMEVDDINMSEDEVKLADTNEDKTDKLDTNTVKDIEHDVTTKDCQLSNDTEISDEPQSKQQDTANAKGNEEGASDKLEVLSESNYENKKVDKALTESNIQSVGEKSEEQVLKILEKKDKEITLDLAKSESDSKSTTIQTVTPKTDNITNSEQQNSKTSTDTTVDQAIDSKTSENVESLPYLAEKEETNIAKEKPTHDIDTKEMAKESENKDKSTVESIPNLEDKVEIKTTQEIDNKELPNESENIDKHKSTVESIPNLVDKEKTKPTHEKDNKEIPKDSENKDKSTEESIPNLVDKEEIKPTQEIDNKELPKECENKDKSTEESFPNLVDKEETKPTHEKDNKEIPKDSENKDKSTEESIPNLVDKEETKPTYKIDNKELPKECENIDKDKSIPSLVDKEETKPTQEIDKTESENIEKDKSTEEQKSLDQEPDTTDEVPEIDDSLGLLAESSRVMEDDEEVEDDKDSDGDDDEDFDQDDESSNQMTAEHSEDSSAQPDKEDGQTDKDDKTPTAEQKEFSFDIDNTATEEAGNDMDITVEESKVSDDVTPPESATVDDDKGAITEPTPSEQVTRKTDVETVKLSDTSDNEADLAANSILKELLVNTKKTLSKEQSEAVVELEGSSSEDDVQEVNKVKEDSSDSKKDETKSLPKADEKSEAVASDSKETKLKDDKAKSEPVKADASTEVFNLDSDDEAPAAAEEKDATKPKSSNKCINRDCAGESSDYLTADASVRSFYDVRDKSKSTVCLACALHVANRTQGLVKGIMDMTPLLKLDLRKVSSETVEISDSDSEDEDSNLKPDSIGEKGAKFIEDHLADVINETWLKYKLDERLSAAQTELDDELKMLEADSKEIDTMLNECQIATDILRNQLYATFEAERRELTPLCIVDTPLEKYEIAESQSLSVLTDKTLKRRNSTMSDQPAKRQAIPVSYTSIEGLDSKSTVNDASLDDDKDVSVVNLSVEAAPSDLPPPGEIARPPLKTGLSLYAMRNSFCTWVPAKILDVHAKNPSNPFTMCRVRYEIKTKVSTRMLAARCLAYYEPSNVRLTIGTRVIALSKENVKTDEPHKAKTSFYSGIVAEIPNPVNSYRYLIFFDHGYAQYVHHKDTRVVCESSSLVWEEVHPNSREFVKQYLVAYPERPMVRLHAGQRLKTEWNGKWWVTRVLQVDASLVEVTFEDNRTEWIYRGSTRLAPLFLELQAAERQRARPLPRTNQRRMNMPYVEYTRSDEQNKADTATAEQTRQQQNEELRRQRAVAKKSTALPTPPAPNQAQGNLDSLTSRVVYYTPKNAVKPYKMTAHNCSPKCKRTDVLSLKDLKSYNPLAKPLLSGWERQIVRYKGHKEVIYRAPCGRRLRNMSELHSYLRRTQSDMAVDLFDFGPNTHCLVEFVLNKCLVGKKDLSHGKENVPVPCVNYYDESLPDFCSYNTERTPTAGVPLNLDPEFLCGCDCDDDCQDKTKCACWKMTLEGARTIGLDGNVGYEYKRLPDPLPSGIYECNSRCKCKHTCLNRVAQHPLQLKLQVFKTLNRGWGIRALNDVPKGAFLCVYAGNLLTDATANLDGLNEGDEYLAELDYIEVVEQMKEGYEEDIPDEDKKLDRKASNSSEEESSSEEEEVNSKEDEDDDFQPGFIGAGVTTFSKRLRKRDRTKNGEQKDKDNKEKEKGKEIDKAMEDDGCITISDDEEAKEPTRFMAQSGIGANEFVSKYQSVRVLYGKDEACYIMDAKVQGNIGRYLNHSCTPNVFVQNVFVDTHDPRFPWVAFFALSHIRAGTELTWNYNYDVGSVPGKILYCYCGAPNCRGRLL